MVAMATLSRLGPLADELEALVARLRPTVVAIRDGRRGAGSGIVWSSDGVVVTNDHVARGETAEIVFADGRKAPARVVAREPDNDLALLRADLTGGPTPNPVEVGDSRALRVGELVIAVGHPMGVEHAVTVGVVSGVPQPGDVRELLRSDLHLNPGNSGGPLVDVRGRVVGVNAMVAGPGTALSIPSHLVQSFLTRAGGAAPYLGVEVIGVPLPVAFQQAIGHPQAAGLLVTSVERGSPAEQAGLYPGDVIVGAGPRDLGSPGRLRDEIVLAGSGSRFPLRILRGGRPREIVSDLIERV
jgi:serine protease Do